MSIDITKKGLLKTMLNRAYRLSSNWKLFIDECEVLKLMFSNLRYPSKLTDATINKWITTLVMDSVHSDTGEGDRNRNNGTIPKVMFSFPFANQETTENTRRQLQRLGSKSVFLCNLFSWVRKSATSLRLENRNRRSLTNSALSIISNLVYAKWTKSVSQIDTYFNALTNTPAQDFRLESTWNSNMESRN